MSGFNESRLQQHLEIQKPDFTSYLMRMPPNNGTGVFLFDDASGNALIRELELNDLTDVNVTGSTAGNILLLGDNGIWGPTGLSLNLIEDFNVVGPTCGEILQYRGASGWVNTSINDYAEMYLNNPSPVSVLTIPISFSVFTGIGGPLVIEGNNNSSFTFVSSTTPVSPGDIGSQFIANVSGLYKVSYSLTTKASNNTDYIAAIFVNGSVQVSSRSRREVSNNNIGGSSLGTILSLNVNDVIDIRFRADAGTPSLLFYYFSMDIVKVGNLPC